MKTTIYINDTPPTTGRLLNCSFAGCVPDRGDLRAWIVAQKGITAYAHPDVFVEQIKWADHVYFGPGDTVRGIAVLKSIQGWQEVLRGKNVYCISAGVGMLAHASYNQDQHRIIPGTGFLPFKTIVHYSDYVDRWKANLLRKTQPDLPVLMVRDAVIYTIELETPDATSTPQPTADSQS